MTRRVGDIPPCGKCGGRFVPLVVCDHCGGASVLRDRMEIDSTIECPDCSELNATQLMCTQCHDRRPFQDRPAPPKPRRRPSVCPSCATFLGPKDDVCPTCGQSFAETPKRQRVKVRRSRRIRGDFEALQAQEIRRIPGVDAILAQALVRAGLGAVWKLRRATEQELAAVPDVGPEAARRILDALRSLPPSALSPTREVQPDEEFECPLCGCVTSAFATFCSDCRAGFEEEEMDEATRKNLLRDGDQGLLAFYDLRLVEDGEDADLWYARGLLLDGMGKPEEAIKSLEQAGSLNPGKRKISIARSRILAKATHTPTAAEQLRTTLREVVDTAALEQELADFQHSVDAKGGAPCRTCREPLPADATVCPTCETPVGAPSKEDEELDLGPAVPTPPSEEITTLDAILGELGQIAEEETPEPEAVAATKASPGGPPPGPAGTADAPAAPASASPPEPREPGHVSTPSGFRSRSRFWRGRGKKATGLVNGAVNGKGLVNGLVNGRGRVNGMVNGRGRVNGMVNGRGRVNGLTNGLTNGRGLINGTVWARGTLRRKARTRLSFLIAAVVMAGIIAGALYLPVQGPLTPIVLDGSFNDWAVVPQLDAASTSSDSNVQLARYASFLDGDTLYLYASSAGMTFGDTAGFDGLYFLLDSDGNPSTGFVSMDLGADYVIEAYGSNGSVEGARSYFFPSNSEVNWSRRQGGPSVEAVASPQGVEVLISTLELGTFDSARFRVGVLMDNFEGARSRGLAPLSNPGGAILAEVRPLTSVIGPASTELFEIRLRAMGFTSDAEVWTVSSFQLNPFGVQTSLSAESSNLTRSQATASLRVSVLAPGFLPGDAVEVTLLGASGSRPVSVVGGSVRAYVQASNTTKRIDGLFADWNSTTIPDVDGAPITNSAVDIIRYGAATDPDDAFFYAQVGGDVLAGSIPQRLVPIRPSPGGNGTTTSTPEPRRTGEDVLRVYVDVNATDSSGTFFEGILADYLFEVRGHAGRITGRTLYAWAGQWISVPGNPGAVAKDASAIEGSIPIGTGPDVLIVLAATDWSGLGDFTAAVSAPAGSPGSPASGRNGPLFAPGLILHSGTNPLTVLAKALTNEPTLDGSCGTGPAEYEGSDSASNANLKFFVGRRSAISYLFVCIEVTADTSDDGTSDWGEILFDQEYEGSSTPQANNRRFRVTGAGVAGSFVQDKGDGSAWTSCGASCDTGNTARGRFNGSAHEAYEFKIRFADIWGSDSPDASERAGFAIVAFDNLGSVSYTWGADDVNENDPGTWGHLEVSMPEFHEVAAVSASVLLLGLLMKRKRNLRRYI